MKFIRKRLDLSEQEFSCLKGYIDFEAMEKMKKIIDNSIEASLLKKLNKPKEIELSVKKFTATRKATEVRSERAKESIQKAIDNLKFFDKPLTHYAISKESGVSFNTVKKYIPDIDKV